MRMGFSTPTRSQTASQCEHLAGRVYPSGAARYVRFWDESLYCLPGPGLMLPERAGGL